MELDIGSQMGVARALAEMESLVLGQGSSVCLFNKQPGDVTGLVCSSHAGAAGGGLFPPMAHRPVGVHGAPCLGLGRGSKGRWTPERGLNSLRWVSTPRPVAKTLGKTMEVCALTLHTPEIRASEGPT